MVAFLAASDSARAFLTAFRATRCASSAASRVCRNTPRACSYSRRISLSRRFASRAMILPSRARVAAALSFATNPRASAAAAPAADANVSSALPGVAGLTALVEFVSFITFGRLNPKPIKPQCSRT